MKTVLSLFHSYVCVHKVRYTVYCCYCFRIIITNFRNDFFVYELACGEAQV